MKLIGALLGLFVAAAQSVPFYGGLGYGGYDGLYGGYGGLGYGGYDGLGYGGYGGLGYGGYGGLGYGGFGVAEIVEPVAPVIPVSSGLVGERSFVDSFIPGSSYGGFGTYGPAYGGLPYPLEAFGPVGYGGYGVY